MESCLVYEHDDCYCWYWITKLHNNIYRGNTTTCAYFSSRKQANVVGFTMIDVIPKFNFYPESIDDVWWQLS
jgi:hypothetical protein